MAPDDRPLCPHCSAPLTAPGESCLACGKAAAPPGSEVELPPVRVGDLFEGKWRIESKLGAGGMGSVFMAHDVALDRRVAIKVLARELCSDAQFVDRFEREARLTAKLEHPNIVPVYAVGRHGDRPFMVMKKLEGETLAGQLQSAGRLAPQRTLEILRQLCAGLGHIHAQGCVHRDIKAGNIFIGPDGHATILDFGVLRDPKSAGNTQAGMMLGTPRYMSPEQARGATDVDPRADLYALAVLAFECLSGTAPFEAPSDLAIIHQHANAPPPDICARVPALPPALGLMLRCALAKLPEDRYQSAADFCAAFEAALAAPAEAPPTAPAESIMAIPPAADATAPEPAEAPRSMMAIPDSVFEEAAAGLPPDPVLEAAPEVTLVSPASAASVRAKRRWLWPVIATSAVLLAGAELAWVYLGPRLQGHEEGPIAPAPLPPAKPVAEPTKPDPAAPVVPKKPVKVFGTLKVVSILSGKQYPAQVEIDGEERGETPVTAELVTGKHKVRVVRAGFQTTEKEVVIGAHQVSTVKVDLIP